mmetsp:Transcript_124579/g.265693  ORF Transcript_124579/g.265693 Transcript_124579/m.265693 type:complete len:379 (-) Transcript_124579:56-1192(-)
MAERRGSLGSGSTNSAGDSEDADAGRTSQSKESTASKLSMDKSALAPTFVVAKIEETPKVSASKLRYESAQGAYAMMSAKARGATVHPDSVKLRKSLQPRDCVSWVHENKQYSPYSYFESPNNAASPKLEKSKGPPALWLPPRSKDASKSSSKGASSSSPAKGTSSAKLMERLPWDTEHHIMHSRMNQEVQVGVREYFDKPVRKEGEGVPKVRERYAMCDRQMGWNDEPAPLGEYRRTVFDNVGPYNIGGCKEQQLPSYWREIKDWRSYSMPDLDAEAFGGRSKTEDERKLLLTLADTPADKTKVFWRGWARATTKPGSFPPEGPPRGWDNRWNVTWSKDNECMNARNREYFSVPRGKQGKSTEAPRTGGLKVQSAFG